MVTFDKAVNYERDRIRELQSYGVLDTAEEEPFDNLVRLAARLCDCPIAMISLVDRDRQWFKAKIGISETETDREFAFCNKAIQEEKYLIVPNALADERFQRSPHVVGETGARFYAGAVIRGHNGLPLGALCVLDTKVRDLEESQLAFLEAVAKQAEALLELSRQRLENFEKADALIRANRTTASSEDRFNVLAASVQDGFVLVDGDGVFVQCNSRACELFGFTEDELCGRSISTSFWPFVDESGNSIPPADRPITLALQTGLPQTKRMGFHRLNGGIVWLNFQAAPLMHHGVKPYGAVVTFTDETHTILQEQALERYISSLGEANIQLNILNRELRAAQAKLKSISSDDELTGLMNHRTFQNTVDAVLARESACSLILINIDRFRTFNETFGYAAGDQVLQQISKIIRDSIRNQDLAARFSGEEFAVILPGATAHAAEGVAAELLENIRSHGWSQSPITISAGIASSSPSESTRFLLLRSAEDALDQAKRSGGDHYHAARQAKAA